MKSCPFCAEEIQDAAIVCKHCRRDLPAPESSKNKSRRRSLSILAALGILGVSAVVARPPSNSSGECVVHARAGVVTHDAPIAQLSGWQTDVLVIRNVGDAAWGDVAVTIYGFETTAKSENQPTGAYTLRKGAGKSSGHVFAFDLRDFEAGSGQVGEPDDDRR